MALPKFLVSRSTSSSPTPRDIPNLAGTGNSWTGSALTGSDLTGSAITPLLVPIVAPAPASTDVATVFAVAKGGSLRCRAVGEFRGGKPVSLPGFKSRPTSCGQFHRLSL